MSNRKTKGEPEPLARHRYGRCGQHSGKTRTGPSVLKLFLVATVINILQIGPSSVEAKPAEFGLKILHPQYTKKAVIEHEDVKWLKDNLGLKEDHWCIRQWRNLRSILIDPPEEEPNSSICHTSPERDLKWKYCAFYSDIKLRPEGASTEQVGLLNLFSVDSLSNGYIHQTVVDIQNIDTAKDEQLKSGVTLKFYFQYAAVKAGTVLDNRPRTEKSMGRKVYDDFLNSTVETVYSKGQDLMSARHLSFLPQVTNVTSGDDFSKRRFWVAENNDKDSD